MLPRAEMRAKALDLAGRIAEKPRSALLLLKEALALPRRQAYEASRSAESMMHAISFRSPSVLEMLEDADVQ